MDAYDLTLISIPLLFIKGGIVTQALNLPSEIGVFTSGLLSAIVLTHTLFIDPPV